MRTFIRLFFKTLQTILAPIILFIDWVTRPKSTKHSPDKQAELDRATSKIALYQFHACPYCVKTRRMVRRLGLNIETRDALNDPKWKQELVEQGGKYQVPCLRIVGEDSQVSWIYESTDINQYLEQRFAGS